MLPGYNGRNRTFFLVNYEGTRTDRGATNFYTVPTAAELAKSVHDDHHRSDHGVSVPQQHHPAVAVLTARAAGYPQRLVPSRQLKGCATDDKANGVRG
jgi:hypothetical protein